MDSVNDQQLLRDYAERRSETAFAELVRRNVDLVYSAALRLVRDAHLAEDVTQGVFLALAQNAGQLADRPSLSGWLHGTTRNLAANAVRSEVRRHAREQEAAAMNELLAAEPGDDWQRIAPNLDAALGELSESDREVLLLRYFKNQSLREVGQTLGTSEDTAQKRVSRAVDQLRGFLAKRGVRVGTSGLVVAVAANAVQAAPVGLSVTISTAAALAGTTIATATVTATKAIAMTALQKTLLTAAVAAVMATLFFFQNKVLAKARAEQSTLLAQMSDVPIQTTTTSSIEKTVDRTWPGREELERLRRETATLRARISELSTQAQRLAAPNPSQKGTDTPIGETLRLADVHDAGQATPAALLQTQLWATLRGDTNRLAQLMAFSSETDKVKVQMMFDGISKETMKGIDAILAGTPLAEFRLLKEQPAENGDRWIVHDLVNKDGETIRRSRIRVRPTTGGWKLVIGADGQTESETVEEQP